MSHDNHNNNGHQENKPVAFTTPLILGCVAVFIILCFVSLGNPCHGKCCDEKECSKECAEKCEKGGHEAGKEHVATEEAVETDNTHAAELPADSTKKSVTEEPAKEEKVKEEAHH